MFKKILKFKNGDTELRIRITKEERAKTEEDKKKLEIMKAIIAIATLNMLEIKEAKTEKGKNWKL